MRCDVNLSLRPAGTETLGTRSEIKNVNSFRFVEKAIKYEIARQADILEEGGVVVQETRLYDADLDETRSMRSKEVANDYRYFPEPDLLPIEIDDSFIENLRQQLPELPREKLLRFMEQHGLSHYDATVLSATRNQADFFEATVAQCGDTKLSANWVMVEINGRLNKNDLEISNCPISAKELGELIALILDSTISGKIAKQIFEAMWNGEGDAAAIIEAKGLKQVSDSGAIQTIIDEVIAGNQPQVEQYRAADDAKQKKLLGFFVGQVMKASKGQANPGIVNQLLSKKLSS